MTQSSCVITVYFEDPFWVGLYERSEDGRYQVCKFTFGAEPKDYEVYERLLTEWRGLVFSPSVSEQQSTKIHRNPKRIRRDAAKTPSGPPVGTKAQEALKLQRQEGKKTHKVKSRTERLAEEERKYQLRREKRKEKHRGH